MALNKMIAFREILKFVEEYGSSIFLIWIFINTMVAFIEYYVRRYTRSDPNIRDQDFAVIRRAFTSTLAFGCILIFIWIINVLIFFLKFAYDYIVKVVSDSNTTPLQGE